MMFAFRSHEPVMRDGQLSGYKHTPYKVFMSPGQPSVALQGGRFWGLGGPEVAPADVPDYVWDEIEKMNDDARYKYGIVKLKRPIPAKV